MAEDSDPALSHGSAESPSVIQVFLLAEGRDFTRFSEEHGDEQAMRWVERFAALARLAVEARQGRVIELRGDEVLAVFGSARNALRAAVELQGRYLEESQRDPSLPLRVGIGLDAGEARPFEGGYRGRAINLAGRLKDEARAGQVLATEALIHLAGQADGLTYVERGLVHPKGVALPVHLVEVLATEMRLPDTEYAHEPELRTFLFSDIRGYTAFTSDHGDAEAANLQRWFASIVEERVRARGGRVLDLVGDAAFAVFVSPRQAIQAAVELQEQFHQAIEVERQLALTLSIGLDAGEAVPIRGKYAGSVVNLTARICGHAKPGEVLIGETLARLVRKIDGLRFIDRREFEVGGHADALRVMGVVRCDATAREAFGAAGTADTSPDGRARF